MKNKEKIQSSEEKEEKEEKEVKVQIHGMPFEFMEDFMKNYINEHPELKAKIRLESLVAKDCKGIELKANQELKQVSTGEFFHIDEMRTFRDSDGVEVDFDHNDENVYEDLEVVSKLF